MIRIAILAYLFGILVFLVAAQFESTAWVYSYYAWDKLAGGGVFVWGSLAWRNSRFGMQLKLVFVFSIIRLAWDIICWSTHTEATDRIGVMVLFITLIAIISYLCLHEKSKLAVLLSKHL